MKRTQKTRCGKHFRHIAGLHLFVGLIVGLGLSMLMATQALAIPFGYSININFSASNQGVRGPAGTFRDPVWNSFTAAGIPNATTVVADLRGKPSRTGAQISYSSAGVSRTTSVQVPTIGDRDIMQGYLASPAKITLRNLDQVVPALPDDVMMTLLIYSFGGQQGRVGTFRVNKVSQSKIDNALFNGRYEIGRNGNVLAFRDVFADNLVIETDGFGPINAMSLIYCRSGDFDGNGSVDIEDLDSLSDAVKHGGTSRTFDVNLDLNVDHDDVLSWIKCSKGTCIGDVNLDGVFDSTDLVELFQAGTYETGGDATWGSGDWNGDCKFDSSDLLMAFQEGCYESDSNLKQAVSADPSTFAAVPEPATSGGLMWTLVAGMAWHRRGVKRVKRPSEKRPWN